MTFRERVDTETWRCECPDACGPCVAAVDPERQPMTTCTAGTAAPVAPRPPGSPPAPAPPQAAAPTLPPLEATGPAPLVGSGDAVAGAPDAPEVSNSGSCAAPQATEGVPSDRRTDVQTLRLAAYNVEFLFDGIDDSRPSRWRGNPVGAPRSPAPSRPPLQ